MSVNQQDDQLDAWNKPIALRLDFIISYIYYQLYFTQLNYNFTVI